MEKKKFVVERKEDKTRVMTIRIEEELRDKYDELAKRSNHSRNDLINKALTFAIKKWEFKERDEQIEKGVDSHTDQ